MSYGFEWDDFIYWENNNVNVEESRNRINEFEALLHSKDQRDRNLYRWKLIGERNYLARLLGMPVRDEKS